jgi:hypothetical protein
MKNLSISKFRNSLFAALLAIAPLSPALHSQDVAAFAKFDVPFAFETASGHHFSPGVYTVRMENDHILIITGASDSALTMVTVQDNAEPAASSKAEFRRYGNRYFLGEISVAGHSRRLEIHPSKAESRMQLAQGPTAPATVDVAVLDTTR